MGSSEKNDNKDYRLILLLLRYIAIVNLAVAQPLYEVLKNSPELFTSHKATGPEIFTVTLLLSFGLAVLFPPAIAALSRKRELHCIATITPPPTTHPN